MTSTLEFHNTPGAGFDEPFEMLVACHGRVQRMLDLLERLAAHLASHGNDGQARQAALDVMRYFDLAGPAHHEDEERHVFPALMARADTALHMLVQRLQLDHQAMTQQWRAVRADLLGVSTGTFAPPREPVVADRWAAFAALYREHIALEESQAYPVAQPLLSAPAQAAMGEEMARRRGAR